MNSFIIIVFSSMRNSAKCRCQKLTPMLLLLATAVVTKSPSAHRRFGKNIEKYWIVLFIYLFIYFFIPNCSIETNLLLLNAVYDKCSYICILVIGYSFHHFSKGNNFCDFLFVFLDNKALKKILPFKRSPSEQTNKFFSQ